jgi:transcriptional antiterminator NusG
VGTHAHLNLQSQPLFSPASANWYAVRTLSRHERVVALQLGNQGLTIFFPTFTEIHRWSDRSKKIELPLFPGYLFVNTSMSPQVRREIVLARGVAGLVTMGGEPIPIPNQQIESVQKLLANNVQCTAHPFLKVGQRVRVRSGALEGVQGILLAHNGTKGLVISIDGIQRSLSVRIEGYDIEVC